MFDWTEPPPPPPPPATITDSAKLDALGRFRAVFKVRNEKKHRDKKIEQTAGFSSIRQASVAVQQIIEARGYQASEVIGAKVIDLDNFPTVVAFITYDGHILDREPRERS